MSNYDPDLKPIFDDLKAADDNSSRRLDALENGPDFAQSLQAVNLAIATLNEHVAELQSRPDYSTALTSLDKRLADLETAYPVASAVAAINQRLAKLEASASTVAPTPTPTPAPVAEQPIWKLVGQSKISIPASIEVPTGQKEIYIPISVDHTKRESFYCYVSGMSNVSGGNINVGPPETSRGMFKGQDIPYTWSPGDDLTHYIKLVTWSSHKAGSMVDAVIRVKGLGDSQKGRNVRIKFVDGAKHPDMPAQYHRPLRRLDIGKAKRANIFTPETLASSPSGFDAAGKPVWRSQLAHGREQAGNGETGLYADGTVKGAITPISYDPAEQAVRLHTRAFEDADRLEHANKLFRQQAVMLNGQTMDAVCGSGGVWRMVAKIPGRRYSWPAFWLIGRSADSKRGGWGMWPPEIDILEKFNYAWGAADTRYTTTFAQHYGNAGSNDRVGAFGSEIEVNQWLPGTGRLDEDYHSWACAVVWDDKDPLKCEVTFFFDDVEVGCQVLHARHQDMKTRIEYFPMMNVAVKAPSTYTAAQYNTDDGRGLSGDMLVRDMGYYPSGFEMIA